MAPRDAHIIVIGGGFSGVAAAVGLRARGARVTLLDDAPAIGGRARSDEVDGTRIDTGAQLISTAYTRTVALLGSAGGAPLQRALGIDAFVRGGVRHPLRFGSVRSLLAFGGLGGAEKLRLAAAILPALAAHHAGLDADAAHVFAAHDAITARAFIAAHAGSQAADIMLEPPLNGFWAMRGDETSLAFYLMLSRYGSGGHVLAPGAGWSAALDHALGGVAVEQRVRAAGVRREGTTLAVDDADGRTRRSDGVVIATGPRSAAALAAPLAVAGNDGGAAAALEWLARLPLRTTWTLALALDRAMPRDAFGVFPSAADTRLVAACAVHGARTGGVAAGRDVVLAWPTPAAVVALAAAPAEAIARGMLPEVAALLPLVPEHVRRARVYRFDEGSPIPSPGFAADRARGRALLDALHPAVAFAGDYLATPLLEGAVASGMRAVAQLAHALRLGPPPSGEEQMRGISL